MKGINSRCRICTGMAVPALLFSAVVIFCAGCNLTGKDLTGDELLNELGISTDESPRTGTDTVHPLQSDYLVYEKKSEIYLSGVMTYDEDLGATNYNMTQILLDDGDAGGYDVLYADAEASWTDYPAVSAAANIDDDYYEEVVILYYNEDTQKTLLKTVDYDDTGSPTFSSAYDLGSTFTVSSISSWGRMQIVPGDIDGDGRDELALIIGTSLLVVDDGTAGFAQLFTKDYLRGSGSDKQVATVAVGNIDTDRDPEIVVADGVNDTTGSSTFYIYAYSGTGLTLESGGGTAVIREGGETYSDSYEYAAVAVGDVDDDGIGEILFAGDVGDGGNVSMTIMDYDGTTATPSNTIRRGGSWGDQFVPALAVFQADGLANGSQEEILLYRYILYVNPDGEIEDKWTSIDGSDETMDSKPYHGRVAVADVDGDGCEDLCFLADNDSRRFYVLGYADGEFKRIKDIDIDYQGFNTTVCTPNLDGDSDVIKYTGEYELLYTSPRVIAVMTSPPYYSTQDSEGLETTFAWSQGTSSTTGNTFGFYVGFCIGYSAETPFWGSAGSSMFKVTVDASFDWSFTTTVFEVTTKTFHCPAGEDQVIFASTPMDVYYYEVVSSTDPTIVGESISIQIPRDAQIQQMELGNYNDIVPEELEIGEDIISHDLGDPWSYPTRDDMLDLYTEGNIVNDDEGNQYSSVIPVSQTVGGFRTPDAFLLSLGTGSSGTQTIEIEKGEEKGYGFNFDLEVGVEFENVSGGVLVGGSAGFHYGYEQSFTTSESTIIGGTLGNFEANAFRDPYRAGLMAYPYPNDALTDSDYPNPFVVVTYWVQE